ncbi:MAG: 5-oxoprolinase subunit PxpB [Bacteroidetes bacterium]|nr:5-oxoprolinase subunit PxpB [Bacteroidota bacterium]
MYPLGDAAACIDLGNIIDESINKKVIAIRNRLERFSFDGLKDIIVAYSSVSVYYDPILVKKPGLQQATVFDFVRSKLEDAFHQSLIEEHGNSDIFKIPVCYSGACGIDMAFLSKVKKISKEEIIQLHLSKIYRVYMIGFLPGFSYLGKIDEKLEIARKPKPIQVPAGSVGIAGKQTGIYPIACPGGWQIIGRTPLKFFDPGAVMPSRLNIGNYVQFYEISEEEFNDCLVVKDTETKH